nr:hypothetical protein [Tanacetum cinerariifolium]
MSTLTFAKTYNLIAYLAKPTESEGFEQIINFLNRSSVSYAFTTSPTIRTTCIKQFWTTAKVKNINDEGTSCLANAEIFDGLNKMGYESYLENSLWKFLIHTILRCLSAKTTSWNEFSSTMASAIICLATNQKFNFSRYILLSLVKNIEVGVPFFMFPRFVQLLIDHQLGNISYHKDIYDNPSLTKKVFANMKRVGTGFSRVVTVLFDNMLVPVANEVGLIQDDVQSKSIPTEPSTSKPHKKHKPNKQQPQAAKVPSYKPSPKHRLPSPTNDPLPGGKDSMKLKELMDVCSHLSNKVLELESEVIDIKSSYKERIEKLKGRVDKLEEENRILKELYNVYSKVDTATPIAKLYRMDLEHQENVLSMQDANDEEPAEVEKVLEVVKAAKLMKKVVTTARATTTVEATKVSIPRKRMGVVIQDPEETTYTAVMHSKVQSKDKGKEQVKGSERLNDAVMKYQALKRKSLTEAQERKNMIIYLKNMVGFKMNYFKGMTYSKIRPVFEKHFNYNQAFLEEVNEDVTLPEKEVEVEAHKREEATPLALKIPIVDYKIHFERNKPYFKIIRTDGNHMLFLSFSTMWKNFDREDLESLWKLVKERFEKTEPKNYSDDYLLKTLKTMFEQPNIEASRYLLTHFTLEKILNNVRLEVEEESEMYLELLRSEDDEYAMAIRDFKKFFKRRECPKPPKDKNQRAIVEGSWSDSSEEDDMKVKNKMSLVAQASSEILEMDDMYARYGGRTWKFVAMGVVCGGSMVVKLW